MLISNEFHPRHNWQCQSVKKGGKKSGFFSFKQKSRAKKFKFKIYVYIMIILGEKFIGIYRKNVQEKTSHMNNIVL